MADRKSDTDLPDRAQTKSPPGNAGFATTQWSVVVAAGNQSSGVSREALEKLCRSYWYPLYAFVRRRGYARTRAEDLTQSFFAHLLEHRTIGKISPTGGRFRSFLLRAITNFLNNEHKFETAQKRGGGATPLSIDFSQGDHQYSFEPVDQTTPDLLFERQWALASLTLARQRLAEHYADQAELLDALHSFISGTRPNERYQQAAERLGMTTDALKVAVHRARKRFRDCLRGVILETVGSDEEVEGEIAYLMTVFQK